MITISIDGSIHDKEIIQLLEEQIRGVSEVRGRHCKFILGNWK